MGHLAGAGDGPAICMVQGVADLAFHYAALVIRVDQFQAIRAAVLFLARQNQFWSGMIETFPLWFGQLRGDWL